MNDTNTVNSYTIAKSGYLKWRKHRRNGPTCGYKPRKRKSHLEIHTGEKDPVVCLQIMRSRILNKYNS